MDHLGCYRPKGDHFIHHMSLLGFMVFKLDLHSVQK